MTITKTECRVTLLISVALLLLSIWNNRPTQFDIKEAETLHKICDGVILSNVMVGTIMNDVGVDPIHYVILEETENLCLKKMK